LDPAVARLDRGRPVGRAVDQQAVAQRHAAQAQLVGGLDHRRHPSISSASVAKKRAPKPRSFTGTRSSAPWISGVAWNRSNSRAGMKPYATQSGNASRNQRESVKPGSPAGTASAPGSSRSMNALIRSISTLSDG